MRRRRSQLFDEIVIPPEVLGELMAAETPEAVRQCFHPPPPWLEIVPAKHSPDAELDRLHLGERQAILLAEEIGADLVLLDDRDARSIAAGRGLKLTGLLGVLDEAASRELLDLPKALAQLQRSSFRVHPALLRTLMERHRPT